jgi:predicted nucleic acid-binding protein
MILLDTNVLARTMQSASPHNQPALDALAFLRTQRRERLAIFPQVITEFYAIATRLVQSNGLGLSPDEAISRIAWIKSQYDLLDETAEIFIHWERLVAKYKPRNRQVFDLRHVAAMLAHNIPQVLTFNDQDFIQYIEIQVLNPFDVLGVPRVK